MPAHMHAHESALAETHPNGDVDPLLVPTSVSHLGRDIAVPRSERDAARLSLEDLMVVEHFVHDGGVKALLSTEIGRKLEAEAAAHTAEQEAEARQRRIEKESATWFLDDLAKYRKRVTSHATDRFGDVEWRRPTIGESVCAIAAAFWLAGLATQRLHMVAAWLMVMLTVWLIPAFAQLAAYGHERRNDKRRALGGKRADPRGMTARGVAFKDATTKHVHRSYYSASAASTNREPLFAYYVIGTLGGGLLTAATIHGFYTDPLWFIPFGLVALGGLITWIVQAARH